MKDTVKKKGGKLYYLEEATREWGISNIWKADGWEFARIVEIYPGSNPEIQMNPSRLKGRKEEGERGRERRRRREEVGRREGRNKSTNHGFAGQNTKAKGMF